MVRARSIRPLASLALLVATVAIAFTLGLWLPPAGADEAAPPPRPAAAPKRYTSGLSPMPNGEPVPTAWMPPGTTESPVPSDEIFPPQTMTLRFNHKKHVKELKLSCKSCHAAFTSTDASDRLLPDPVKTCDACHDVSHADLNRVVAGKEESGACTYCHLGEGAGATGRVARFVLPAPNLRFTHKKHLDRNIGCAQCHGRVEELELATREQLPRMAGCFGCHALPIPARGEARGECTTCHITEPSGKMVVEFATGQLLPPDWLHMSGHTPDWIERHKSVAGSDSRYCGSCHKEEECAACHDGRVRDRRVHPNDWITMHQAAARLDNPRCTSCHQVTQFCGDCHRRVGVARDAAVGSRPVGARFHPPPATWTYAPRGSDHHAWEAERNLNACVSCHAERDCATCHATKGVAGGGGVNPHPSGFAAGCKQPFSRNPRPCLVCHGPGDTQVRKCQ